MITTLVLQDQPQGYILSYFYKLLRAFYLSPEWLLNFLSNLYIPPCVGKISKFMEFTFLENVLIRSIFTHAPPHNSPLKPQAEENYSFPPGSILSKICFPLQQRRVEETMIFFIKFQSENRKMSWNIRFLYYVWFAIFSNLMALQFCK